IAQALGLAERFVGQDKCIVILGDNIFEQPITTHAAAFEEQASGARVLLRHVEDPQRFGVATVEDGRIVRIVEKPTEPESDLAVTGIYMYGPEAFDYIRHLKPSDRGELEITDVNNAFIEAGSLSYSVLDGSWTDAGTFESLAVANRLAENLMLKVFEDSIGHGRAG
ncbi:MAG: spore coat protein, partial [Acidimicrobiia bacterium]|nr:spore coat protein [Acidimicrobiia bacterium]